MGKEIILLGNGSVLSLDNKSGETTSLKQAVGVMAISTYEDYVEYVNCTDQVKREGLKEKLLFQTKVLNSLSTALKSVT